MAGVRSMKSGAIKSIRLSNFMTYSDVYIEPGPSLNIIVAPNGTGKSSIVCGLCLGLGGSPSVLGRAKDIVDYIKHGENNAKIIIELYSDKNVVLIERSLSIHKPNSIYKLNQKPSSEKEVREVVRNMGIHVGSLCQLLPQDRVADFTKMTPQQLLLEVENTVLEGAMKVQHVKLIDMFKNRQSMNQKLTSDQQDIAGLENRKKIMQEEINLIEARKTKSEIVVMIDQKIAWLNYEKYRLNYYNAVEEFETKSESVDEIEKSHSVLTGQIETLKRKIQKQNSLSSSLKNNLEVPQRNSQSYLDILKKMQTAIDTHDASITQSKNSLLECDQSKEEVKMQLQILNQSLSEIESSYQEITKEEALEINNELTNLIDNHSRTLKELGELTKKESDILCRLNAMESELNGLTKAEHPILKYLKFNDKDTFEAINWLRENKHLFKQDVFEPIILQITVSHSNDAKYLENQVSRRDLFAFLCQNVPDMNLFIQEVREKRGFKVSVVSVSENFVIPSTDSYVINLKKKGCRATLKDTFDCPKPIMSFLCQNYRVHNIPIFDNASPNTINELIHDSNIQCFFSGDEKHFSKKSVYSREAVTQVSEIRSNKLLSSFNVDHRRIDDLKDTIKHTKNDLNQTKILTQNRTRELNLLEEKIKELKYRRNSQRDQRNRINMMKTQREAKEKRLEGIESMKATLEASKNEHITLLKDAINKKFEAMRMDNNLKKFTSAHSEVVKNRAKIKLFELLLDKVQNESRDSLAILDRNRSELQELEDKIKDLKEKTHLLMKEALEISGFKGSSMPPEEYFQKLDSCLPKTSINELKAQKFQIESLNNYDADEHEKILQEFEKLSKKIDDQKKEVHSVNSKIEASLAEEERIKNIWLDSMNKVCETLSEKFSSFFSEIACSGRVEVCLGSDGNYEACGLNIMVKYRPNEEISLLSANRHSGGERSVATILFLLALQHSVSSPFRLVDEVNQGMDEINERKVLSIIMKSMANLKGTQCFFLSPKIIPDMEYSENTTVIVIYNGPFVNCSLEQMQSQLNSTNCVATKTHFMKRPRKSAILSLQPNINNESL